MPGMDHPPRTSSAPRPARRALLTAVAALSAVAAPIVLVAATVGSSESSPTAATAGTTTDQTALVQALNRTRPVPFDARSAPAAPTTTAPPPPTTTTTAPPPPPPPPPPPAPAPTATSSGYNDPNNPAAWDRLAQCESGGNWAINTGNGYYGGLQFSLSSWRAVGGTGYPHEHSRETQIAMGQRLWNQGGWGHWPACSRKLGY